MSKVSVFRFKINNTEEIDKINQIIDNYLNARRMFYDNEKQCYMTAKPTKQDNIKNAALSTGVSVVASVLTGGVAVFSYNAIQHGFEYQINGNELVIKAYLIVKNAKKFIHSIFNNSQAGARYYGDLQGTLFKELKNNNVLLTSKEVEKINDGSEFKTVRNILIYFLVLIIIFFGIFLFTKK